MSFASLSILRKIRTRSSIPKVTENGTAPSLSATQTPSVREVKRKEARYVVLPPCTKMAQFQSLDRLSAQPVIRIVESDRLLLGRNR
jgi:hypothetical protein